MSKFMTERTQEHDLENDVFMSGILFFKSIFLSSTIYVVLLNLRSLFKSALHDYARQIGIDPENEPELVSLAVKGFTAPLPPEWTIR